MAKKKYPFGEKNLQNLLLLGANDEYKADMNKIEKKYNPPSDCDIVDGKEELEFLKSPKSREMMAEYFKMMEKHGFSSLFDFLISYLVESGYFSEVAKGKKVKIDVEKITDRIIADSGIKITDKKKDYFELRIYSDTTIKDIQKVWPEIKRAIGKKEGRKKISKKLERDLYINKLKNQGLTAKQIIRELKEHEKFKNETLGYEEISKIIKRLKNKAKKI